MDFVVTHRMGSARVTQRQLAVARSAVAELPAADRALLARRGLRVTLEPRAALEGGLLGATKVQRGEGGNGPWAPRSIRVAARVSGVGAESLREVVQHEIGHALAVLREQDRSEDAARRYARRY